MTYYQFKQGQQIGVLRASTLSNALKMINTSEARQTLQQVRDHKLFKACINLLKNDDIIILNENVFFNLNTEGIKWTTKK